MKRNMLWVLVDVFLFLYFGRKLQEVFDFSNCSNAGYVSFSLSY